MQFCPIDGKLNTPLLQQTNCLDYIMETFPKSFMRQPEPTSEESEEEEEVKQKKDRYVLLKEEIASAQWINSADAKVFENFVDTMLANVERKKLGSSTNLQVIHIDELGLLKSLMGYQAQIVQLRQSNQVNCNLQRFYLVLLPFLASAQTENYHGTKEILATIFETLIMAEKQESFNAQFTLNCYLHIFNNFTGSNGLKADAFLALTGYIERLGRIDCMVMQLQAIEKTSAQWSMTPLEKRHLFRGVYLSLDRVNDPQAFKVVHAYLKLHHQNTANNVTATEQKFLNEDARRCCILAIKARDVINFEELLELESIKGLQKDHNVILEFLHAFTQSDSKEFEANLGKFKQLMAEEKLETKNVILKKSYLQICQLSTETMTNFKYEDLANLLNIDKDDVEEWAIEAIQAKIIDAKIDQLNEEIVIKSHMMRKIGAEEWQTIHAKVSQWKQRFQRMHDVLNVSRQMSSAADEQKVAM